MTRATDELLHRMVRAIVGEVDPEQVIIFGSRLCGDAHDDSDVDLIVVEAQPLVPRRHATRDDKHLPCGLPASTSLPTSSSTPPTRTTGATPSIISCTSAPRRDGAYARH